jgi:hypothetical protein
MGRPFSTHGGDENLMDFKSENLKGMDHLGELDVHGMMI